ncbi:oxytocin receptor-like [Ornithodoros turicata]|uniref:oxytocin receptor-like n=1 Tax=Ornithodoros turicata TaxID=34597 RepID=UPI003138F7E2
MTTNATPYEPMPVAGSNRDNFLAQIEIAVLALIFGFTLIGNSCVLLALAVRRFKMTRMYYFLLHLCLADLITGFFTVLPQLAWDVTYRFQGGNLACKSIKYLQILGPYLSSYVLVVTAVDRYQAICFPLSNCSWTPTKSKLMIAFAWTVSSLCCLPQVFIFSYQQVEEDVFDCWGTYIEPWGVRAYVTWYGVSVFFLPLTVLTFTYVCICRAIWHNLYLKKRGCEEQGRSPRSHSVRGLSRAKIKTVKTTVIVIAFYVVCSSPFICVQLLMSWTPNAHTSNLWSSSAVTILMLLNSLNSCVNPWIYLSFNRNLMNALRQLCCPRKDVFSDITREATRDNTQGTDTSNVHSQSSPVRSDVKRIGLGGLKTSHETPMELSVVTVGCGAHSTHLGRTVRGVLF